MNAKLYLGAAAGAVILAGLGVGVGIDRAATGAPFINPILIANALCGGDAASLAKRRAFFVRIAAAYADETAPEAPVDLGVAEKIGDIAYKITTASEAAQAHFNIGLAYTWNFNHGEAIRHFQAAQAEDPECAMCYWAEALARGPNINAPMADEDVAPAFAAISKAQALAGKASEKERVLIKALAARYAKNPPADRSKLDNAFADAMDKAALQFPDDDFIATLAAEANMDTQPWSYWAADGRAPVGRTSRTLSLIEAVLARNPAHPAAIHLYIHMTEASRNPHRAAPFADRLASLSPGLGHLIHMPSHTYYRIGRFKESIIANANAVAADEAFLGGNEASVLYEFGYYTHNVHFLMTSAQMAGDGATALAMAAKLDAKLPAEMAAAVPFAQPIKVAPYFAMAQYAAPEALLDLADPGPELPFLQAAWRYARGEAFARSGDADGAEEEAAEISRLLAEADFSPLEKFNIPARDVLNIERLTLIARAAAIRDDLDGAIEAMTEAVAIQDAIAYTEPPYWYYPAKQTLAAMVLKSGDTERAEHLFVETLAEAPNNGWVLYGLAETYRAEGDKNGAKFAANLFRKAWAGDPKSLSLDLL